MEEKAALHTCWDFLQVEELSFILTPFLVLYTVSKLWESGLLQYCSEGLSVLVQAMRCLQRGAILVD